jgi:diguanylate cyclase (GGDEF)-like protein
VLYDATGAEVAAWQRPGSTPGAPLDAVAQQVALQHPLWRSEGVVVVEPVQDHGRALGRVALHVSTLPLHERDASFAMISLLAGVLALGLAWLLTVGLRRDIDRTEARLDELAHGDPVTGLSNRHAANAFLQAAVQRARADGSRFALMLLDLDDFKLVNDSLGHSCGDDVLRQVAQRLREAVRPGDAVFRFGGDEFIVVCNGPLDEDDGLLLRLGRAALAALQAPLQAERHEIHMRGSIGIAQFPLDAADAQALLRSADTAMYAAKALGKNTAAVYRPHMDLRMRSLLRTDSELRRALERNELVLHYQPIVQMRSGRLVGVEALVRWQHPERGLLPPSEFIEAAEASGLIVELGGWVLEAAARQLVRWRDEGYDELTIAVNVSGKQIRRGVLGEQVAQALQRSGADARLLQIEITEHTLVEDVDTNIQVLSALRAQGMTIAVDDFGTGLSSLAYLKRLPIDKFKIDRSFVRELPHHADDVAIVTAVMSMAQALGLQVVAEGVENEAQRELLGRLGCDHGQGYFFSRPVPAAQLLPMLPTTVRPATLKVPGAAAGEPPPGPPEPPHALLH